jgi:hypothetical protein
MTPWNPVMLCLVLALFGTVSDPANEHALKKGDLLYSNSLSDSHSVASWVMEGPGKSEFQDGWMHLYSPQKEWDHVLWCPENFPSEFIAEWDVQNMEPAEGLLIVFFAATGLTGEDIFDPALPKRDGTFRFYTRDKLKSYHVSYYTNNPKNPERKFAHLRKNNAFALVQTGSEGIPKMSTAVHRVKLIKNEGRILFLVDDRKVLDWNDDGKTYGPVLGGGKVGFRQMRWSHFRYRNFKVWAIKQGVG